MVIEYGWAQEEDGRGYASFCFDRGARAVLSEIEEAIKHTEPGGSPYVAVLDKIKQLKGE